MSHSGDNAIHERRAALKGSVIIRQGDRGICAFLIQSGRVGIYVEHNGHRTHLAELTAGQIFGEMALIGEAARAATAVALEDTNLVVITKEVLNKKLAKSDPMIRAIVPMLIQRIVQTNDDRMHKAETIQSFKELIARTYKSITMQYPPVKRKTMENIIQRKLEEFLDALTKFEKMNSD